MVGHRVTAYTAERQRTMSIRALRRLSETEMLGLGHALTVIEKTEAQLVEQLGDLRRAAAKEQRVRRELGLPGTGHYGRAYIAAHRLVVALTTAREETATSTKTGRIPRRLTK